MNRVSKLVTRRAVVPVEECEGYPSGLPRRVNAYDGLFLRATHLNEIQEFSSARLKALGYAGGVGVIEGLTVRLSEGGVTVTRGLGVDGCGQLLSLARTHLVPLPELWKNNRFVANCDQQSVWVITLRGTTCAEGCDEVYGSLCDDPCAGESAGSIGRPYEADRVAIDFEPVWDLDLRMIPEGDSPNFFSPHSRIVSAWFERERNLGLARLIPTSEHDHPSAAVASGDRWLHRPMPSDGGLAVGLVWFDDCGCPHIDQWAARRERVDPPNRSAIESQLGMRSWSTFMAQIHQFQSELGQSMAGLAELAELPPAGYLPSSAPNLKNEIGDGFSVPSVFEGWPVRSVHRCRRDEISRFVLEAQHLDRIQRPKFDNDLSGLELFVSNDESDRLFAFRRFNECQRSRWVQNRGSDSSNGSETGPEASAAGDGQTLDSEGTKDEASGEATAERLLRGESLFERFKAESKAGTVESVPGNPKST